MPFFLDVDDTLMTFNSDAANEAVYAYLRAFWPEAAAAEFRKLFSLAVAYHQDRETSESREFLAKLNSYPVACPDGIEKPNVIYSRELYVRYLSDKHRLQVSDAQIAEAMDAYWNAMVANASFYPDARRFVKSSPGCFIAVGSDSRLVVRNGKFSYDSEYARKNRMERTRAVGLLDFVPEARVIIGDPFRKPGDSFWQECLRVSGVPKENCIMVDDSPRVVADARRFGFTGVLMDRKGRYGGRGADHIVASFDELKDILRLPIS
ncbi:HAD family hydrolase [Candidatus Woesearchaeota archaeon]|nr:HAD family hydrolase [Candidatus Woesearchaeota archaeon]